MSNQTNPAATAAKETAISADKATAAIAASRMLHRVEDLAIQREVWETSQYARSNAALYNIFAQCLELYRDLTTSSDAKALKQGLMDYINIKGYVFKESSPLTLKVIRCVFGEKDRRRLSTYHTVLRVAVADGWSVAEVAQKIVEYGGIQEITLSKPNGMTPKAKAEWARAALMSQTIGTLSSDLILKQFNNEHKGESAVAVMTLENDGSYSVHCVVKSASAVNAALAAYFGANKVDFENAQKQKALEAANAAKEALINSAAQAANESQVKQAA